MGYYEERLEKDITLIRRNTAELAEKVEVSIRNAAGALLTGNTRLSCETVIRDNIINRENEDITKKCYAFIARHLPSAGHLRRISSILHVCVFLERIGDQAVTISRVAVQLSAPPDAVMTRHVERLTEESCHMLHQAVNAFNDDNVELARGTKLLDSRVDSSFQSAYADLSNEENKKKWMIKDLLGMLSVCYSLERVSDLSKNICEKTIFSVLGQTKIRKPVSILFLAESNNHMMQTAMAVGRKSFSECGRFAGGGKAPENESDPLFISFMEERGLDFDAPCYSIIEMLPRLDEFDVIISLQGPVNSYISVTPFNVDAFEWEIGAAISGLSEEKKREELEETFRRLVEKIGNLLEIMRGEGAVCGPG